MTYDIYHVLHGYLTRITYDQFTDLGAAYGAMNELVGSAVAGIVVPLRNNHD